MLYSFKCNKCGHIFLEPYNPDDLFSHIPPCSDCGDKDVLHYDGVLPFNFEPEGDCLNCANSFVTDDDELYCVIHEKVVNDEDKACKDYN